MPGKEEESRIACRKAPRQFVETVHHGLPTQIVAANDFKPQPRDRIADRAGVVGGLFQLLVCRQIEIAVIAYHQRDALLRERGLRNSAAGNQTAHHSRGETLSHGPSPLRPDLESNHRTVKTT
jgi:hypothetical protein